MAKRLICCIFRAMEIFINLKLTGDSLQLQTAAPNSKFAVADQNGNRLCRRWISRILCFLVSSKLLGSLLIEIKVTFTPILLHTSSWLLSISLWFWSSWMKSCPCVTPNKCTTHNMQEGKIKNQILNKIKCSKLIIYLWSENIFPQSVKYNCCVLRGGKSHSFFLCSFSCCSSFLIFFLSSLLSFNFLTFLSLFSFFSFPLSFLSFSLSFHSSFFFLIVIIFASFILIMACKVSEQTQIIGVWAKKHSDTKDKQPKLIPPRIPVSVVVVPSASRRLCPFSPLLPVVVFLSFFLSLLPFFLCSSNLMASSSSRFLISSSSSSCLCLSSSSSLCPCSSSSSSCRLLSNSSSFLLCSSSSSFRFLSSSSRLFLSSLLLALLFSSSSSACARALCSFRLLRLSSRLSSSVSSTSVRRREDL